MEIRKIECNGHLYEFINETWETSTAWGHSTTLLVDGIEQATRRVRYYNRTWECYRYQTCMMGCISSLIDRMESVFICKYRIANDIKRLTKQKRQIAMDILSKDEKYQELLQVKKDLQVNNS